MRPKMQQRPIVIIPILGASKMLNKGDGQWMKTMGVEERQAYGGLVGVYGLEKIGGWQKVISLQGVLM
jgi:hypothetical protein